MAQPVQLGSRLNMVAQPGIVCSRTVAISPGPTSTTPFVTGDRPDSSSRTRSMVTGPSTRAAVASEPGLNTRMISASAVFGALEARKHDVALDPERWLEPHTWRDEQEWAAVVLGFAQQRDVVELVGVEPQSVFEHVAAEALPLGCRQLRSGPERARRDHS